MYLNHSKIIDRLWLGSHKDATECLKDPSFVVVTVARDCPVTGHFKYSLTDPGSLPDEPQLFMEAADKVIELLANKDKQVLVHCFSGINRSTSIVIAVVMKLQKLTLLEAYNLVKAIRPFVWPFPRHLQQALIYNGSAEVIDVTKLPDYGGFNS